jgi:transposase-like protein
MSQPPQRNGTGQQQQPDPEVVPQAKRRVFSLAYKRQILEEADNCEHGEVGALLRREGLYSSHLTRWRRARDRGELAGSSRKKRGRKRTKSTELKQLERENERLQQQLQQAELIIEAQKKLSEALGITLREQNEGVPRNR